MSYGRFAQHTRSTAQPVTGQTEKALVEILLLPHAGSFAGAARVAFCDSHAGKAYRC